MVKTKKKEQLVSTMSGGTIVICGEELVERKRQKNKVPYKIWEGNRQTLSPRVDFRVPYNIWNLEFQPSSRRLA